MRPFFLADKTFFGGFPHFSMLSSRYNIRMGTNAKMINSIKDNAAKVLFAVATGIDLSKLEIKARTGLSMSTVIAAVDRLVEQNLVTFSEEKSPHGGKMRSRINVRPSARAYGISYKSGVLTATAVDLKGEAQECVSQEVEEGVLPVHSVLSLALALQNRAPEPLAIALSLNCENKEDVLKSLEDRFGVKTFSTANTAAVCYRSLWQDGAKSVAAIGVGSGVKCAFLDGDDCRVMDFGALPSPYLLTEGGTILSALCAAEVEEVLRHSRYRGRYFMQNGFPAEVRDLADYSRALAKTVAFLVSVAQTTLSPQKIVLFGDYLSETFFARVKEAAGAQNLVYLQAERSDFSIGSALCALTEGFFS